MPKPFEVTSCAKSDLIDISEYISDHHLGAGMRFLVRANDTFQQIGVFPRIGFQCFKGHARLRDIRCFPVADFKRYLVFYNPTLPRIRILRVLHTSQDIQTILDEARRQD